MKKDFWGKKTRTLVDELSNEINVLRSLDHPNIVKAYEVYYGKRNIHIVMEHCSGGHLYSRRPYSEKESRDLKFENIMFENTDEDAETKLIDFGLSKKFLQAGRSLEHRCHRVHASV